MDTQKLITLLSIVAILLIIYRILMFKEDFGQIDICDYNSPDPNDFCKSIQKGCTDLISENNNLNTIINDNCTTLPTDTRDVIDAAITCNDNVNKLIMNNYVQKEVCTQIKNYPNNLSLTPSSTITPISVPIASTLVKPLDYNDQFILNSQKGFAPF